MSTLPEREAVGTLMRHVLELLDGDVATVYRDAGVPDYRPRFSPAVRALVAAGPMSIRALAGAVGVTHSAASQTVAQMAKAGYVTLEPGTDARQRIVHLTPRTHALLPLIQAEWSATTAALRDLDADLPAPLSDVLLAAAQSLSSRSFRARMPPLPASPASPRGEPASPR
ncbi:MarR family winged helix-turn-helix transcriptional regulator [Phytohabitans rumicis]|uniref:MarR family winged helix-turn-helix transcriptional regulator n=1 Tax=Phytohabitans rumicis TaxID=1076125 RepID=UPI0031E6AAA0